MDAIEANTEKHALPFLNEVHRKGLLVITISSEAISLLVWSIEEEVSLKPLWVANKVSCNKSHVFFAPFRNYPHLSFLNVN
ncbi:hypothetical protein OIU84_016719 [Salix udensis]|uniref:Uncharacterized protein n=1 Tax=Salix udensis TaxID=889485 RepID=A0AAD6JAF8_9ROSI|nr:hypothetical protein OIU84_016719 [Salix udensis]